MADTPAQTSDTVDDELNSVIELLKTSAEAGVPGSVQDLDGGDEGSRGPASHAFKEKNAQLKNALSVIDRQRNRIKELEESGTRGDRSGGGAPPPPAAGGGMAPTQQDALIYQNLRLQALRSLGIEDETQAPHSFNMEMSRLWASQANQAERRRAAISQAPAFIDRVLSTIPRLSDEDREAVKSKLKSLDVLQQLDEDVVRSTAAEYLGQKLLRGEDLSTGGGTEDGNGSSGGDAYEGDAAPVGDLKNTGRPGSVKPPVTSRDRKRPDPPTPEEAKAMRQHGFTDVVAYRKAKEKKDKYKGK